MWKLKTKARSLLDPRKGGTSILSPGISGREAQLHQQFVYRARQIRSLHHQQTRETVATLNRKYQDTPLFGEVRVWELIMMLSRCIDPTDTSLYSASQLVHVMQILQAISDEQETDPDFILIALIHDLGKLLLLTDEAPENIVCFNKPIGQYTAGVGLDNCVFEWNHDELCYMRIREHVSEHIAWVIRYHSIKAEQCEYLMDDNDRKLYLLYLKPFMKFDQNTKSMFELPTIKIEDYREFVEDRFPEPIWF